MIVFKFGGASVRNALAIRKVAGIIRKFQNEEILMVISAMGKTTNALEKVVADYLVQKDIQPGLGVIRAHHDEVIQQLFEAGHPVRNKTSETFKSLESKLSPAMPHDQLYDQIVSFGEILSSIIVSEFLIAEGLNVEWLDARKYIITDDTYREGKVDWTMTENKIASLAPRLKERKIMTQGFIGSSPGGSVTTLGREGSDYSAAIFASCLNAKSVTIWKDVPGVMNADPRRLPEAIVFEELPYRETAEMTYYGASVIHPKTIKPLANKNIPLFVKNFDDPSLPGTLIHETKVDQLPPLIVFKDNQCLISCRVTDYTFIDEHQLGFIFQALSGLDIKINVMQNSAISFSFCVDFREEKILKLVDKLAGQFEVYYNTGLTLITIKNYNSSTAEKYRNMPGVILEQLSRSTLQVLISART